MAATAEDLGIDYYSSSDSEAEIDDDIEGCTKNDRRTVRDGDGIEYEDGPNEHKRDDQELEEDDSRRPPGDDGNTGAPAHEEQTECEFWRHDEDPGQRFSPGAR